MGISYILNQGFRNATRLCCNLPESRQEPSNKQKQKSREVINAASKLEAANA